MSVWIMNLKDNRDDKPNLEKSKFEFCKEKEIVGIGWAEYDSTTSNDTAFLSANAAINAFKCDDLVWVHNSDTKEYYICQITGLAQPSENEDYKNFDIGTYCTCKYYLVGSESILPQGITGKSLVSRSTISSADKGISKLSVFYFKILTKDAPQANVNYNSVSNGTNQEKKKNKKSLSKTMKKRISIIMAIIVTVVMMALLIFKLIIPEAKYQKALKLCKNGKYDTAIEQIYEVIDYRDASEKINDIRNEYATSLCNSSEFEKAMDIALSVSGKPNEDVVNNCVKGYICQNIDSPRQTCDFLTKYKNSITMDINDISCYLGCVLYNRYDFSKSYLAFGNGDSALNVEMGKKARYTCAVKDANNEDLCGARANFAFLAKEKYKDSYKLSNAITKKLLVGTWVAELSDTQQAVLFINEEKGLLKFTSGVQSKLTGQLVSKDTAKIFWVGVANDDLLMMDNANATNYQSTKCYIRGSDSSYELSFSDGYYKDLKFSNFDKRSRSYHMDIDYGFIDDKTIQTLRDKILTDYQK